ncbi:MAG: ComF family protein [Candidatus Aerophobetes bacterium]|nr:ComF family protein [Candidatus Aerophobetes bacterium]
MKFKDLLKGLISLVFPADCKICGAPLEPLNGSLICESCWSKVKWINPPYCPSCSKPFPPSEVFQSFPFSLCLECQKEHPYFKRVFVPTLYKGVMKKAIHLFKYERKMNLIQGMKKIVKIYLDNNRGIFPYLDLVVSVPLHRKKLKERGFNQAELLAKVIAKHFNLKLVKNNLKRVKSTQSQAKLSKRERIENIKKAFLIKNTERFRGKSVLLVDDVYTTGTTVNEIAKILKRAKAKNIYVFTLARA